ncbi:MAG: ral nucleoside transport system permease protein [Pseudonocardiales bacterium]|nr:ral nucleoside transport system permease protein [Pseudonocardiales bacterium]
MSIGLMRTSKSSSWVPGTVLLGLAAFITIVLIPRTQHGLTSRVALLSGTSESSVPLPSSLTLTLAAALCAMLGVLRLLRSFGRRTTLLVVAGVVIFVFAVLVWASRGQTLSLPGLLQSTLLRSVPITLGALSGVLCERSGVINVAIEAQMLMGAFLSAIVGSITGSPWVGLAAGAAGGGVIGWLLAVLAIRYRVDQIIAGFALNILVVGLTSYLASELLQSSPDLNSTELLPVVRIPLLADIPMLGQVLFDNNVLVYLMFVILALAHVGLFHTRWGLRVRAVGEHPRAADTVGINPLRIRYQNVVLGGIVAGIGGAYFVLGSVGRFDQNMTGGRGYIALVAVILGGWAPLPAFGAALVFGFADAIQTIFGVLNAKVPAEFLLMVPYIATIIAVTVIARRAKAPAADGIPYIRE